MNERMQDAWLAELSRVIKPGGALLLTVYGEAASERLARISHRTMAKSRFSWHN
jgi:ubiquinone/menaquinone biosynthesis C-methylase UbiE